MRQSGVHRAILASCWERFDDRAGRFEAAACARTANPSTIGTFGLATQQLEANQAKSGGGVHSLNDTSASCQIADLSVAGARLQARGVRVVWGLNRNHVFRSRTPRGEIILAYPSGPSPARKEVSVLKADGSVDEITYAEIERRMSAWHAEQNR